MRSSARNFFLPHDPAIALASISELSAGRAEVLPELYRQRFCRRQARFQLRRILRWYRIASDSSRRIASMIPKSGYRFSEKIMRHR